MQDINDALIRKHCREGASVVTHFWVPTKQNKTKGENEKIQKYIKNIFERNPKNNRSEKRMLKY
jgi:hypothetical protein